MRLNAPAPQIPRPSPFTAVARASCPCLDGLEARPTVKIRGSGVWKREQGSATLGPLSQKHFYYCEPKCELKID
jgi:hypothetical protein